MTSPAQHACGAHLPAELDHRQKVLIVDDDSINVDILHRLLEDDYELAVARNGEDCLRTLETFRPGVVLLDIMMPGIDGYETCRRIKALPAVQFVQVILVSAKASTNERLKGYAVGADDYVVKPFDHDELLAKVRIHFRLRDALELLARAHAGLQDYNRELERIVEERTAEIVETRDVTVFALAKLAESRDPETGEHLERMRCYSQLLAEDLSREGPYTDQIDERFLKQLYRSSPLHDIGKVGIPDGILQKNGPLTDEEFNSMKRHTVIGYETLSEAVAHTRSGGFLHMAADIARCHHERFDGTGYPAGLKGEEIPLAARIVALADVYDALTSARVYKPAFDPLTARAMIEAADGSHFDPAVVDAFRRRFDRFLTICDPALWRDRLADEDDAADAISDPCRQPVEVGN